MKYFRILDDINYTDRWYLGDVDSEDNWQFVNGKKTDHLLLQQKLTVELYQSGRSMDFTTTESVSIPIVKDNIKTELMSFANLEFIPVRIGEAIESGYYIMLVNIAIDCVDECQSEFAKFENNDPIRPDLSGHYSWFAKLILDKHKIHNIDIFYIKDAAGYLIVSETVKQKLEKINASGIVFKEV